jgi:membrane-associated phospholipid phosphatase
MMKNKERYINKHGMPYDVFGMPSGHAQAALFSTVFIYLSLKKTNILLFYLLISAFTMVQRIYNNYHTLFQIIIGDIVGALFAWFVFHLAQQKLKGRIREKRDDYGPI